jgi:hypothetical protein
MSDAEKAFDWCLDTYGFSKHHDDVPWLDFSDDDELGFMGEYSADDNALTIYPNHINTYDDLIETMIHEYQHYLQSPTWFERYYNMGHDYKTHPYEVQAETIAKRDKKICSKSLN